MKLKDFDYNRIARVRKLCVQAANDGEHAKKEWKDLYFLESVADSTVLRGLYLEVLSDNDRPQFWVWNECDDVCVRYFSLPAFAEIESVENQLKYFKDYIGTEGFITYLQKREQSNENINDWMIEALTILEKNDLVEHFLNYRKAYKEKKERIERKMKREEEFKRGLRGTEAERAEEIIVLLNEAEDSIRQRKAIYSTIDGKSIVSYLLKKWNIITPPDIQEWISNCLFGLIFNKKGFTTVQNKKCENKEELRLCITKLIQNIDKG